MLTLDHLRHELATAQQARRDAEAQLAALDRQQQALAQQQQALLQTMLQQKGALDLLTHLIAQAETQATACADVAALVLPEGA